MHKCISLISISNHNLNIIFIYRINSRNKRASKQSKYTESSRIKKAPSIQTSFFIFDLTCELYKKREKDEIDEFTLY